MQLDLVDPELHRAVRRMPRLPVRGKVGRRIVRAVVRRGGIGKPAAGVTITDVDEGQRIRLYTPAGGGSGAALLWVHGGGYLIDGIAQDDALCSTTARELDIVVVSADYRLAPEHPFPAALDDTFTAWQWLQASAGKLGIDPERVALGGSSAGAGLAACLVQRLHDAGGTQPLAQWLLAPMLDDRTAARRELDPAQHLVWNNAANRTGWGAYLGGLPAAWIGVGDIDLFTDECRAYADRLREAGVDCAFDLVPGAPHGFEG
ncbi:alpha/beta hydrolase [Streptomyces sp. NBC_01261]|uniref:alpha/beta hydrolase n=1 Tax=Streptomyces sp. NBC_01261 TaxID=2903802 RepID=UPI002E337051|nr:alpha/beta hydrolase [Streptomyces sp. NBC_01261]